MCEYLRPVVALEWTQGLLLLYRHDHVDVNFIITLKHDDSKKLPVMVM